MLFMHGMLTVCDFEARTAELKLKGLYGIEGPLEILESGAFVEASSFVLGRVPSDGERKTAMFCGTL